MNNLGSTHYLLTKNLMDDKNKLENKIDLMESSKIKAKDHKEKLDQLKEKLEDIENRILFLENVVFNSEDN